MARNILSDDFDDWYTKVRGRTFSEDLQRKKEKEERKDARREREYEMRMRLERQSKDRGTQKEEASDKG